MDVVVRAEGSGSGTPSVFHSVRSMGAGAWFGVMLFLSCVLVGGLYGRDVMAWHVRKTHVPSDDHGVLWSTSPAEQRPGLTDARRRRSSFVIEISALDLDEATSPRPSVVASGPAVPPRPRSDVMGMRSAAPTNEASGTTQSPTRPPPGSESQQAVQPLRLAATMRNIRRGMGLTNVLMTASSFLAWCAMAGRVAVFPPFPSRSPVDVGQLLNLTRTMSQLAVLGVAILLESPTSDVAAARVVAANATSQVLSAWQAGLQQFLALPPMTDLKALGLSTGKRERITSLDFAISYSALDSHRMKMRAVARYPFVAVRDMFMAFPYRATAPIDLCFFIQRLAFHDAVVGQATRLLMRLRGAVAVAARVPKTNQSSQVAGPTGSLASRSLRLLALHLRIEADASWVPGGSAKVDHNELRRFLSVDIAPIIRTRFINVVYVCAGQVKAEDAALVRSVLEAEAAATPSGGNQPLVVHFKTDFPELDVPTEATVAGSTVTNHFGAAVDLLVLKAADVAVALATSSFPISVMAHRCPSPALATGRASIAQLAVAAAEWPRCHPHASSCATALASEGATLWEDTLRWRRLANGILPDLASSTGMHLYRVTRGRFERPRWHSCSETFARSCFFSAARD